MAFCLSTDCLYHLMPHVTALQNLIQQLIRLHIKATPILRLRWTGVLYRMSVLSNKWVIQVSLLASI